MVTCNGPRCSGESCREADSIPWCAIQVSLVPSSSVQALVPTGAASVMREESIAPCCAPRCDPEDSWAAAVSAAAAVFAAPVDAAVDTPAVCAAFAPALGLGPPALESGPPALGSEAPPMGLAAPPLGSAPGFWASKALSAVALLLPPASGAPRVAAELLVGAPDAFAVAVDAAPANAPASACSKRVRALDTGSAAECFAGGALEPSAVESAVALPADVLVGAAPSVGVAASDWARAAEKSLAAAAACAATPCVAAWAAPVADAADALRPWVVAPAACPPEPELLLELREGAERPLPDGLERDEFELAAPELDAEDRSAGDCLPRDAEEFAAAEGESAVPEPAADEEGELPALGAVEDVAAGELRTGERPDRTSAPDPLPGTASGTRSLAMGGSPAGPELLRSLVALLLLDLLRGEPFLGLPVGGEVADRRRSPGRVAPALVLRCALQAGLREDVRLLPQRLVEAAEKDLIFARAGAVHAGLGAAPEIPHVAGTIGFELLELRLRREHILLARGQRLRLAPLDVVDDAPHHADPLSLFHLPGSERVSLRAARLAARSTRSRMSCCRKRCMRGQSASA